MRLCTKGRALCTAVQLLRSSSRQARLINKLCFQTFFISRVKRCTKFLLVCPQPPSLAIVQLIANLAELPAARAGLRGALPVLEHILAGSGSAIHKRFAAQAVQQVTFQHAG